MVAPVDLTVWAEMGLTLWGLFRRVRSPMYLRVDRALSVTKRSRVSPGAVSFFRYPTKFGPALSGIGACTLAAPYISGADC